MEQSFDKKRFNAVMNITHIITKFGKWILIAAFGFATLSVLIGIVLMIINVDLGAIEVVITEANLAGAISDNLTEIDAILLLKQVLVFGGLAGMVTMAFLVYVLHNLDLVLNNVKAQQPFVHNNAVRLFNLAYSFMIASIILPIFQFILRYQIMIENPSIDINAEYTIYTGYLFVGLLLYILAHIFAYGSHLQTSYDETV
ncbi:MAG: DUF2975 domain-containing protein [Bacillota bacterium]